jgi:hypothetical protein
MQFVKSGTPINISATAAVSKASGTLIGFYVNNKTAGATLVLSHGSVTGGTAITGTITPLIGFHCMDIYCPTGLFATIAVQPMDITFFFAAG